MVGVLIINDDPMFCDSATEKLGRQTWHGSCPCLNMIALLIQVSI
jgi:hypothetical protein